MKFLPSGKERIHFIILSLAITTIAVVGFVSIYHGYQTYAVVPATFGFLWAGFLFVLWKYCKQSIFQKEARNTPNVVGVASSVSTVGAIVIDIEREHTAQVTPTNETENNSENTRDVPLSPSLLPCPTYTSALTAYDPNSEPPSYETVIMNNNRTVGTNNNNTVDVETGVVDENSRQIPSVNNDS